jgi:glutathione S-transferase
MAEKLKFYNLRMSPNNVKVRIALNYKGLDFESIEVPVKNYPPAGDDRAEVVQISSQPLTPVLVHGDRVVFDSSSIIRYLDANFRDTSPLFSADFATMRLIEDWERFARTELGGPVSIGFQQALSEKPDPYEMQRACEQINELTGRIEKQLNETEWLVGHRMTAADVTAAPVVFLSMLPPEAAKAGPIPEFFVSNLELGAGRVRTRQWAGKIMEYNR